MSDIKQIPTSSGVTVIPKNIGRQGVLRDRNKNKVTTARAVSYGKATLKAVNDYVDNTIDASEEYAELKRNCLKQHMLKWLATSPTAWSVSRLGGQNGL